MKLLLVEDEQFAREGLLSMISKENLGISEIIPATDGEDGLEKAGKTLPDIILSDVRMPHMDGITMSAKIREFLPDCCVIFMSGYSDKEYLKSAIRLSAVNYIEKPFQPQELFATLQMAVSKCRQRNSLADQKTILDQKLSLSIPAVKNEIAQLLTRPQTAESRLHQLLSVVWPDFSPSGSWITFLICLLPESENPDSYSAALTTSICNLLTSQLALSDFSNVIIGTKNDQTILVHLHLQNTNGSDIPKVEIGTICYMLRDMLQSTCRFLLSTGQPVEDFFQLYRSYQTASICLQRGFFHRENAVLFHEEAHAHPVYSFPETDLVLFERTLRQHNSDEAFSHIRSLSNTLRSHDGTLVSAIKNHFSELLQQLYTFDHLVGHPVFSDSETQEQLRDTIWNMNFLTEIEEYMQEKLSLFFAHTDDGYARYPLAYQIRLYLNEHFHNPELSLLLLTKHFSVSESYACIVFKKAFDQTINQYIINLRITKAKEYLLYSNKKIKEISELVGYPDCNYFIRLFKKNTGVTPADYRQS